MKLAYFYFVDFGANIGMYSVVVTAMGRKAVAVDAMLENLAHVARGGFLKIISVGITVLRRHENLFLCRLQPKEPVFTPAFQVGMPTEIFKNTRLRGHEMTAKGSLRLIHNSVRLARAPGETSIWRLLSDILWAEKSGWILTDQKKISDMTGFCPTFLLHISEVTRF